MVVIRSLLFQVREARRTTGSVVIGKDTDRIPVPCIVPATVIILGVIAASVALAVAPALERGGVVAAMRRGATAADAAADDSPSSSAAVLVRGEGTGGPVTAAALVVVRERDRARPRERDH